jgi:hypothetical protein
MKLRNPVLSQRKNFKGHKKENEELFDGQKIEVLWWCFFLEDDLTTGARGKE